MLATSYLSIYLRTLSYDNFITDSAGTAWKVCHHRFICHGQSDIISIFMASQQMSFVDHMVNLMWFIWFILFKTSYTSAKVNPVCHFQLQASTAGLAIWGWDIPHPSEKYWGEFLIFSDHFLSTHWREHLMYLSGHFWPFSCSLVQNIGASI